MPVGVTINLATPFFTVYLVRQLGFDMTFVMLLSVASQIANLFALRNWGALSDRFANKSVLSVAAPTYILCIVAMVGASQIAAREALIVYLIVLHLFMGAAVAGVTLATTNIALKLSPRGSATAYVATSAFASSMAAGLAPILGGVFADFFSARQFELLLRWTSPDGVVLISPLRLFNWDFYFLLAGLLGLYALHRLALVREEGEIDRRERFSRCCTRRAVAYAICRRSRACAPRQRYQPSYSATPASECAFGGCRRPARSPPIVLRDRNARLRQKPHEVEAIGDALVDAGFTLIEVPLNSPDHSTASRGWRGDCRVGRWSVQERCCAKRMSPPSPMQAERSSSHPTPTRR